MCETDLDWVLRARNSQSVRGMSGSSDRIRKRDHRIWFDCSINSWKFVFTEGNQPKGVVIYDKVSTYWSFYLVPSATKHSGLGRLMLSMFLVYSKKKGMKRIKARVRFDNLNSYYLHEALGFKFMGWSQDMQEMKKEL